MADQRQEAFVGPIPPGNPGIHSSVLLMVALARLYSPRVVAETHKIAGVSPLAARSGFVLAAGVHEWLIKNMRYTSDADDIEEVRSPDWTLTQVDEYGYARGDCDDYVVIGAALAKALGLRVKMRVVSQRTDGEYDHVYLMIETAPGRWSPSDAIGGQAFGWSLTRAQITAQRDYEV